MAQQNPERDDQVLDLTALADDDRPKVKYPDGTVYKLIALQDLGILESTRFELKTKRLSKILAKSAMSETDAETLADVLNELCCMIVRDAPADATLALSDTHKLAIVGRFNESLPQSEQGGAGQPGAPLSTSGS